METLSRFHTDSQLNINTRERDKEPFIHNYTQPYKTPSNYNDEQDFRNYFNYRDPSNLLQINNENISIAINVFNNANNCHILPSEDDNKDKNNYECFSGHRRIDRQDDSYHNCYQIFMKRDVNTFVIPRSTNVPTKEPIKKGEARNLDLHLTNQKERSKNTVTPGKSIIKSSYLFIY